MAVTTQTKKFPVKPGKYYTSGNDAIAEGALVAGCLFFGGYPITPSSEVAEHISKKIFSIGGAYIQMEDELASIAAVLGASWGGKKSMTATSGPGLSLMLENIGLGAMTETPCVIINIQRGGPSTGMPTHVGQQDIMQARWGSHGDYQLIALSPWSVQEAFDMSIQCFNLSEKWRVPVIMLADEVVGHMMESIEIPPLETIEIIDRKKPIVPPEEYVPFDATEEEELVPAMATFGEGYKVFVTGLTHDEQGLPQIDEVTQEKLVKRLNNKIIMNADKIIDYETYNVDDAELVIVSFGISARAAKGALRLAREAGYKVGFLRLKVIWPFPEKAIEELSKKVDHFLVAEINNKQIFYEVDRCAKDSQIHFSGKLGTVHSPDELFREIKEVLDK